MKVLLENWGITPLTAGLAAGILLLVIAGAVYLIAARIIFKNKVKAALADPEKMDVFRSKYPPGVLLKRSGRMEKYAQSFGSRLIIDTGLASLWAETLESKLRHKDMRRVLAYCPESSLFTAFTASLNNPKLKPLFIQWMDEKGEDEALRILATVCRGEIFDGAKGLEILGNQIDTIREMTGDPEWHSRFFAYQIILEDTEDRSIRALWDAFDDSYPAIRKKVTDQFNAPDREKLYKKLWDLVTGDPVYEVRRSAKDRIVKDFSDLYQPDYKNMKKPAALRLLGLLDEDSDDDRDMAVTYLQNDDLELRYPAARFLEKCGVLKRMLTEATLEDREDLNRKLDLLSKAAEVNISSFLECLTSESSPGALFIGARLLRQKGSRRAFIPLGQGVFRFFQTQPLSPELKEIYTLTLEGISERGGEEALTLYLSELKTRKGDPEFLAELLSRIPLRADYLFLPVLEEFFKDPAFPLPEELVRYLSGLPSDQLIPLIFDILNAPRGVYAHGVRISALKLLGELKQPYLLQRILETLPVLPQKEAREYAPILKQYPTALFEERVGALFESSDGQLRASLLAILPATGNRSFMKEIRASLNDADPDVRIAAIWSLLEFQELKLLNQETSMLRDPVERVRIATARVLGEQGTASALEALGQILKDPNEVSPVKKAAIAGLGFSKTTQSIDMLVETLDEQKDFAAEVIAALGEKTDRKSLTHIIELFKDAAPELRESLVNVFIHMSEEAEAAVLDLLKTDVASLRPYLAEILETTGYVEKTIRKLSHRDVKVRKEAALWLSLLETRSAFRGIVLAARDPDQDVRVLVVKALEKLNTPEGRAILDSLKEDPDRRIRKYTLWAMERLHTLDQE